MDYFNNIDKAISFIEENLINPVSLDKVASIACLSKFHFSRCFKALTGESIGDYIKGRRLSKTAEELITTKRKIIDIAFDYGYNSPEAYTRSFKNQFSITPSQLRNHNKIGLRFVKRKLDIETLEHLVLKKRITDLEPEIVFKDSFNIIGKECITNVDNLEKNGKNIVDKLWQDFLEKKHTIKDIEEPKEHYCLGRYLEDYSVYDFTSTTLLKRLVGLKVKSLDNVPEGMSGNSINSSLYAKFTHKGDVNKLGLTYDYIYGTWFFKTDYQISESYNLEFFDHRFNHQDIEHSIIFVYIPITKKLP